jgi:hypothetical protein
MAGRGARGDRAPWAPACGSVLMLHGDDRPEDAGGSVSAITDVNTVVGVKFSQHGSLHVANLANTGNTICELGFGVLGLSIIRSLFRNSLDPQENCVPDSRAPFLLVLNRFLVVILGWVRAAR